MELPAFRSEIILTDNVQTHQISLQLHRSVQGTDSVYAVKLVNEGGSRRVRFVRPMIIDIPYHCSPSSLRFFVNGFTSFSGTGSVDLSQKEKQSLIPDLRQLHRNFHIPRETRQGFFNSALYSTLSFTENNESVTLGFLQSDRHFTQIKVETHPRFIRLIAQIQWEDFEIEAGAIVQLPSLFVSNDQHHRALDRYLAGYSENMQATVQRPVPNGWCTWYHYYTAIDEKEFLKNLDLARDLRRDLDIPVFQLDDGYQESLGSWLQTNDKFPSGIRDLAGKIRDYGFIPGIWTAPFFVHGSSDVVKKHPHWLLRDKTGRAVRGMWNPVWGAFRLAYVLDISHPEVQGYLRDVFTGLYDMGIRFFKVDFLFAVTLPGLYHDKSKTSFEVLQSGLKLIRECVKDAYVLGCGCPLEAAPRLVDSMRVGNDVTPHWTNFVDTVIGQGFELLSTKLCIRNTINRSNMHGRLFQNDPDCLITRKVKNTLSAVEMKTLARVNALSGGPLMISDDLAALDRDSLELLREAFALGKEVASEKRYFYSPDAMDKYFPEIQIAEAKESALAGLYNFADKARTVSVDFSRFLPWDSFDIASREASNVVVSQSKVTAHLQAHDSAIVFVSKT